MEITMMTENCDAKFSIQNCNTMITLFEGKAFYQNIRNNRIFTVVHCSHVLCASWQGHYFVLQQKCSSSRENHSKIVLNFCVAASIYITKETNRQCPYTLTFFDV